VTVAYERIDPEELGAPRGFTHGMLAPAGGRLLLVAGQDAAERGGSVTAADFLAQFSIALAKVLTVVRAAGGGPEDIGRLTVYVTDVAEYRANRPGLGDAWKAVMGRHYPAMALVQVEALVDPAARVEIEATAVIPPPST